jgi:Right handed beta helix region/PEP-CTERM motif
MTGWAGFCGIATRVLLWLAAMLMASLPARAQQVVVMTPTTVAAALAAVRPGDTLRMEGHFTSPLLIRNRDFGGVQVDAGAARFSGSVRLVNVHNISFTGGTWQPVGTGDAIRVERSSHVSFAGITVAGTGNRQGTGMRVGLSQFVTVRDTLFDGVQNGLVMAGVTDSLATRNRFANGSEDGMKLLDSQRVIVSHNSCTGFAPLPGFHPDCIQFWSLAGKPLQSDIYVLNNYLLGAQQGLASFDPYTYSGTRFTFAGNYMATIYTHALSCLGCTYSRFEDNILVSLPEARHRSPLIVTGSNEGNSFSNNQTFDLRGQYGAVLPDRIYSSLVPSIAGQVGSMWDNRSFGLLATTPIANTGVPEPRSWILLIAGFGLVGAALRRRGASGLQAALHHHEVEPAAELFPNLFQQPNTFKSASRVQPDRRFVA